MEISKAFSKWVYEDGMSAIEDSSHPCRPMVDWQTKNGFDPFQLPEPFTGSKSDLGLAFIGLNPSICQSDTIPKATADWTFEKYDEFYRNRVDNGLRREDGKLDENVVLWNNIERFGSTYLSELIEGPFRLGVNASLIEVVRFKSTEGWLGATGREKRAVLDHQNKFTQSLLEETGLNILVPMGVRAIHQTNELLKFRKPVPSTVRNTIGQLFVGETKHGAKIYVCPIKHMSYPTTRENSIAVSRCIISAFEKNLCESSVPSYSSRCDYND